MREYFHKVQRTGVMGLTKHTARKSTKVTPLKDEKIRNKRCRTHEQYADYQ